MMVSLVIYLAKNSVLGIRKIGIRKPIFMVNAQKTSRFQQSFQLLSNGINLWSSCCCKDFYTNIAIFRFFE